MSETNDDHAQVGALLAKCSYFEVDQGHDRGWSAMLQFGTVHLWTGYGPTQLAAIRAAVEAAEKGVRE